MLEQIDSGGTAYYYHADQLGSVRALTNQSGAVAATYTYDAYGNQLAATGNVYNPLRYAGEYQDSQTGFYYLRARYYAPATAQFLTRDPLVAATEQAYTYANGSPLNYTDPSGLFVDTLLDAAFITMDAVDVACNGLNWENALYLGADLLGLAIPFATGLGLGARAAFHGSEGIHVLEAVHNIAETTGKHLLTGNRAQKALREGKEVHVFHEGLDLSELERLVWTEGTFQGTIEKFQRFVYRSDTPIGSRILNGQKTHDLYYIEIKGVVKGDGKWHYHMDPRVRPRGVK